MTKNKLSAYPMQYFDQKNLTLILHFLTLSHKIG